MAPVALANRLYFIGDSLRFSGGQARYNGCATREAAAPVKRLLPRVANAPTALLAGVITGVCGFTYEWMSSEQWTQSERGIYFMPVAVVGFLLPMIFLVAGIDYFIEQTREWEDLLRLGGRVVLWFAGAAGTTFVLDLVLRLLS